MKVFAHTLCLFATFIGVSSAVKPRSIDEYWQHSTQVGSFQSAWEAIGQEGVYYLRLATKGSTYDCVTTRVTQTFPDKKTVHYRYRAYRESPQITEEFRGVYVVTNDTRGKETTLDNLVNGKGSGQSQVVFTERGKCFVLYWTYAGVYQLWVQEKEKHYIPRSCEFAYWLVTYGLNTHVYLYKETCEHNV
uniref:Putative secreted protein n=2 Tax=Ixodes ricinus TaxID=34613 RepID=A0A090XB65_IXORI